jgi:hypothetical protein
VTRPQTELLAHDAVELVELPQRRGPVSTLDVPLGQREVGGFVGRVCGHDLVPVLGLVQQLDVQATQMSPRLFGPRFVEVLGQQLASVRRKRRLGRRNAAAGDRRLGVLLELHSVDLHVVIGAQPHGFGVEDDGPTVPQGLAGVVRCLVQAGCGVVDAEVWPQGVDHLLTVKAPAR